MKQKEIEEKLTQVDEIYKSYLSKIAEFKKEQDKVIGEFIDELEKVKIEEVRNKLKGA